MEQKNLLSLLLLLLLRPITGHKGPDGVVEVSEVSLYSFFSLGARWRWVIKPTPWTLYPREKAPIHIVQEAGWDPGPVWTGAKNLSPTEIRSPDRPSCSESLLLLLLLILLLKFKNIFDEEQNILLRCEFHFYSSAYIHSSRRAPKCLSLLIFFFR